MHKIYGYIRAIHAQCKDREKDLLIQTRAIRSYSRKLLVQSDAKILASATKYILPRLEIAKIYSDVGIPRAGENIRKLPAGQKLLMKIGAGDHLVIGHFARVFAKPGDFVRNMRIWQTQEITVHLAQKNLRMNMNSAAGQLILKFLQEQDEGAVLARRESYRAKRGRAVYSKRACLTE